jgi:iron complex outermembrane receptor protein
MGLRQDRLALDYTPRKSSNANLRYELPIDPPAGKLVVNASVFAVGPVDIIAFRAKGYALADRQLDWNEIYGSPINVGIFVKNVFDKTAIVSGGLNAAGAPLTSVIFNEPRMFGVQARVRFAR